MRKLMMGLKVGLLVVGLLAMVATPAMAQFVDPLTLAASGVLLPYFGAGNNLSILEVATPVRFDFNLHFVYYNATCTRVVSFPDGLTTDDVELYPAAGNFGPGISHAGTINGLVAIADVAQNGIDLNPLFSPIHTRVYWINVGSGIFRVLEPIILDAFEVGGATSWSPIRTGATFFAPQDSPTSLQTTIILICPTTSIQGAAGQAFPTTRFPAPINASPSSSSVFKSSYPALSIRGRVFDDDEFFLRNIQTDCQCLVEKRVTAINDVYTLQATWTELETDGTFAGFTGYKAITFQGVPIVDLFGRLSNGNRLSLIGNLVTPAPPGCGANCR